MLALAVLLKQTLMPYLRPLQQLRQQLEELTGKLDLCQDPDHRRQLLKRMRSLIEETDKLIFSEVLNFDSVRGGTTLAPPLADRLYSEMQVARKEWQRATEELKGALALFRDLNATPASADGNLALKNARLRASWTLKQYRAAVEVYGAAVRANR
jgi:hypothetical protein